MKQILAAALVASTLAAGSARAQQETPELPLSYRANVMMINDPMQRGGIVRLNITIEGWTTNEDRTEMAEALQARGTDGLVAEMQKRNVGYLQVDSGLRYVLRVASTWESEQGRHIRIATERPMHVGEHMAQTRSLDYPIGVAEFVLPAKGPGEGSLLAATKVRFDDQGRLVVQSLPGNTGPQRMTSVEPLGGKKKGKKKKRKADREP